MLYLARISVERPRACLAVLGALTLGFAAALPRLELRTDGAALHPLGDPTVERTAADRRTFADPEEVILLLTPRPGGPSMSSAAGLRQVVELHARVAALPGVRAGGVRSVASLIDVATSGVGALGTLQDELPESPLELEATLRRLRRQGWTDGLYLAPNGTAAALYVPLEPGPDRRDRVAELERWAAGVDISGCELRLTGPVIAEAVLGERVLRDLARLVPVMVVTMGILLLAGLRTAGGVIVAMSKILAVLVWAGGLMSLLAIPITLVTTLLPVLLLALAVTDEVHVITRFQSKLGADGGGLGSAAILLETLAELRGPVVTTSVSTAIGFLSFLSASIVPLRHFGGLAAAGILTAMLMTFTLTPALAAVLPRAWFSRRGGESGRRGGWQVPAGRRGLPLALGGLLAVAAVPGLARLSVQDAWIDNFDPDSALVRAERDFNEAFWGTYRFDAVLRGAPGFFHRPAGVGLTAEAARIAAAAPRVGGVVTYLEPLDRVAGILGLAPAVGELPADALRAVVEVAAVFRRQIDLERLVTPDGSAARLLVVVNSPDYASSAALAEHLEAELAPLAASSEATYQASGDVPLAVATVRAIVGNQLRSIAWTLAGVALFLLLTSRDPWRTLTHLLPPAAAAWLVLSGMGYAGLPLGVATSLFTALTLGVGIDLALHLTGAFDHHRRRGLEAPAAVRAALASTAAGRRWSTAVLAVGFLVLTTSAFGPNHDLGLLLAAAMAASHLTTWLFVPWMLER